MIPKKIGSRNGGPDMNTVFFRKWIVQSLLRQVIHIPQKSPENIKLSQFCHKKNRNWPLIQRHRKWCIPLPKTCWRLVGRIKVGQGLYIFVGLCCHVLPNGSRECSSQTILFLQNKSTCLGIKKNDLGGNSHDPPCARLKINGTVTSHKPGKRKKHW